MEEFIARITERIAVFDWQGPGMFGIILLAVLGLIKQFKVVLITLFTVALAWGAGDLVITNMGTGEKMMSLPLLIYCIGGGIACILFIIAMLKTSIK